MAQLVIIDDQKCPDIIEELDIFASTDPDSIMNFSNLEIITYTSYQQIARDLMVEGNPKAIDLNNAIFLIDNIFIGQVNEHERIKGEWGREVFDLLNNFGVPNENMHGISVEYSQTYIRENSNIYEQFAAPIKFYQHIRSILHENFPEIRMSKVGEILTR